MVKKKKVELPPDKGGRPTQIVPPKRMLKEVIPVNDLFNDDELLLYNSLVDIFLNDFDEDDLTAGDLDDIMTISMNKVHEIRLLKMCKDAPEMQLDISQTIEKSRKQTEKIKENLSSRRRDRVDPNEFKGFSIVDLAAAFDNEKKIKLLEKTEQMKAEEKKAREGLEAHKGNQSDKDGAQNEE